MRNVAMTTCLVMMLMVFANIGKAVPVVWSTDDGGNGHFYEVVLVSEGIDWESANVAATEAGGYLATITSAEENDFVHILAVSNPDFWHTSGLYGPWLGGFQPEGSPEPAGGWQWVTGEPFVYTNWSITNPDNGNAGTENRIHFHDGITPEPYTAKWNDLPSDYSEGGRNPCSYVIEYIPEPATLLLLGLGAVMLRRNCWSLSSH